MPQAASVVEQSTERMAKAFQQAMEFSTNAMNAMKADMEGLQSKITALEAKIQSMGGAHRAHASEMMEARHALHGFGEEVGIHMPRFVQSYLTSLEGVAPMMAAAFTPIAIIGAIEAFSGLGEAVTKGINTLRGWTEELKKANEEQVKLVAESIPKIIKLKADLARTNDIGLTGTAKRSVDLEAIRQEQRELDVAIALYGKTADAANEALDAAQAVNVNLFKGGVFSGVEVDKAKATFKEYGENEEKMRERRIELNNEAIKLQREAAVDRLAEQRKEAEAVIASEEKTGLARVAAAQTFIRQMAERSEFSYAEEIAALKKTEEEKLDIQTKAINARLNLARLEHQQTGGGNVRAAETTAAADIRVAELKATEERDKINQDFWKRQEATEKEALELTTKSFAQTKKLMEEIDLGSLEIMGKHLEDETRAREVATNAAIAAGKRLADAQRVDIQSQAARGLISTKEKIRQLQEVERQEYATALAGAQKEKAGATTETGKAEAQAKIDELTGSFNVAIGKLNAEMLKATLTTTQIAKNGAQGIMNAFNNGFDAVLAKQKSFGAAMTESFRHMADQSIMNIIRTTEQMLIAAALHKASAAKEALVDAKGSAVAAFHSVMKAVPFPFNVVLAPATAAGIFAAAMSFATFEQGGVQPKTQMSLVHSGERVLTERQNTTFERIVNEGSSPQYHFHQAPGSSPNDVTASTAAFQRMMRDGRIRA
jgi:hypothetical protein